MKVLFLCIPMQGGTDFVSGERIVFWSWLSGRFRFIRNDGGSRRRRGHNKREEKNVMANG
jgi:hypothetical protein